MHYRIKSPRSRTMAAAGAALALLAAVGDPAVLSLPGLIETALRQNPGLAASGAAVAAAAARPPRARSLPDPMVMAGVENVPVDSFRLDREPMSMVTVGVSQMVPFPGKLAGLGRSAESARRAEDFRDRALREETAALVRAAYYELVYIDRARELTAAAKDLMDELARAAEAGYGVGMGLLSDPLQAQVEAARMMDEQLMYERERAALAAELNRLTGARPGGTVEATAPLGALAPLPSAESLREAAARANPLIAMRRTLVETAREDLAVARLSPYPDPTVSLSYGFRQDTDSMSNPDLVSAQVLVPAPLWRKGKQDQEAAERDARLRQAEAEAREEEDRVMAAIETAWAEADAARQRAALLETGTLPLARQALAASRSAFLTGKLEFRSALDSQVKLYQAELRLARLKSDYYKARAELDRLSGRPVDDILLELRKGDGE